MSEKILFSFIKEYDKTKSMSGKVWRIKVISGVLKEGTIIRFLGVKIGKIVDTELLCTIKSIYCEGNLRVEAAEQNDIVTIDVKNCVFNGNGIDKQKVNITTLSVGLGAQINYKKTSKILLKINEIPPERLEDSLLDRMEKSLENRKPFNQTAYELILLWFGKMVSIGLTKLDLFENVDDLCAEFEIRNGNIFYPDDAELNNLIKRVVLKYRVLNRKIRQYVWKYVSGEVIFERMSNS